MSAHSRRYSTAARAIALLLIAAGLGCRRTPAQDIDLLRVHPPDERRAGGNIDEAIRIDRVGLDAASGLALVIRAPARVIWNISLPHRSTFHAMLTVLPDSLSPAATGVVARVGISSNRWYEELRRVRLDGDAAARWQPLDIDLSPYSGRAFSLFYQPSRRAWRLVVSVDAASGGTMALAQPAIIAR